MKRSMSAAVAAVALLPASAIAQVGTGGGDDLGTVIVRVEEDWEVVLLEPEMDLTSPQFHTVMSPFGDVDEEHFQTSWNYRELDDFASGGLQTSQWHGENWSGSKEFRQDTLSLTAETVRWTQVMRTTGSSLNFRIKDGQSQTWGSFGGAESRITTSATIPNLNGYRPATSAANSWISYGQNRVSILRIVEARGYDANDVLVVHDTTSRVIFQQQSE